MLVLSRKKSEVLVIDEQIRVHVLQIQGNRIRLGIEAPADVSVRRGELPPRLTVFEGESACEVRYHACEK